MHRLLRSRLPAKCDQEVRALRASGNLLAFLILSGVSTETVYETNEEGLASPVSSRRYEPGEVCAADEPDIHRVSNEEKTKLINLHVYTPPLSGFYIYSPFEE